jgi:hypothetical protein
MDEIAEESEEEGAIVKVLAKFAVLDLRMFDEREVLRTGANGFGLYSRTC